MSVIKDYEYIHVHFKTDLHQYLVVQFGTKDNWKRAGPTTSAHMSLAELGTECPLTFSHCVSFKYICERVEPDGYKFFTLKRQTKEHWTSVVARPIDSFEFNLQLKDARPNEFDVLCKLAGSTDTYEVTVTMDCDQA